MRKPMIPPPPQAKGAKKPPTEFEAFDKLATRLLKVPKSKLDVSKKNSQTKRSTPKDDQ